MLCKNWKLFLCVCVMSCTSTTWAFRATDQMLDGLAWVESQHNPKAKGDWSKKHQKYQAIGAFQIWDIYMKEANRLSKKRTFTAKDRWNYKASRDMARLVLNHWGSYFERKGYKVGWREMVSLHLKPCAAWRPKLMKRECEQKRFKNYTQFIKK